MARKWFLWKWLTSFSNGFPISFPWVSLFKVPCCFATKMPWQHVFDPQLHGQQAAALDQRWRKRWDSMDSSWSSENWVSTIWRFPEIGLPLDHPFFRIFHSKPSIRGYPHLWKPLFQCRKDWELSNSWVSELRHLTSKTSGLTQPKYGEISNKQWDPKWRWDAWTLKWPANMSVGHLQVVSRFPAVLAPQQRRCNAPARAATSARIFYDPSSHGGIPGSSHSPEAVGVGPVPLHRPWFLPQGKCEGPG